METYIFGHKNPDADAICSAIGYAAFKEAVGQHGFVPARCGNSNSRIDAILQRFQVPLPVFIGDITPRLSDIMVTDVRCTTLHSTCAEALETIDLHDVRALPVVEEDGRLAGQLTIFDLGEYFTPRINEPLRMRRVHSTIGAIVRSLKADIRHLHAPDVLEDLFVRIGAMDIRSFGNFSREAEISARQSIIVVGDRWDIQEKSIQLGVRLLVITGGLEVDDGIVERAREKDVSLIVSPYDSATTSWIIRSASFVTDLVDDQLIRFHREDRVKDVRRKVADRYAPLYYVEGEEGKLLGVFSKTDLLRPSRTRIVLVDHNELTQAVPGAAEVEICEIIDHHRLGNVPTEQPILFINRPLGSTCSIVADLFRGEHLAPEASIAGVLMAGIISDTLNLTGPTTTPTDRSLLEWLSGIAGVNSDSLAEEIFSSGSIILSAPAPEVVRADCKIYEENGLRFAVSQIEELGYDNFWAHSDDLMAALTSLREEEKLEFAALLVTDINRQNSLLVIDGSPHITESVTYSPVVKDRIFDLPGIVSRKKQLIPYLSGLLREFSGS